MTREIAFFASNDPHLNSTHIRTALQIAEDAFATKNDPSQISIDDKNVLWTRENIPFCWTLILVDTECVGSAAVLPTEKNAMTKFLNGQINENALLQLTQKSEIGSARCLYLSGVSVLPELQKRGLGSQALIHAIEGARKQLPQIQDLYCSLFTDAGKALIQTVQTLKRWNIRTRDI